MSYHVLRAAPHLAEQKPSERGHKLIDCQVNQLIPLQPVGEILGICGVDDVHMTLEDVRGDELLLAKKQQEAGGDGPSTCGENLALRELVVESAKYEAPRHPSWFNPQRFADTFMSSKFFRLLHTLLENIPGRAVKLSNKFTFNLQRESGLLYCGLFFFKKKKHKILPGARGRSRRRCTHHCPQHCTRRCTLGWTKWWLTSSTK